MSIRSQQGLKKQLCFGLVMKRILDISLSLKVMRSHHRYQEKPNNKSQHPMSTDLWPQGLRRLQHVQQLRVIDLQQHSGDLSSQTGMHVLDEREQTLTCGRREHVWDIPLKLYWLFNWQILEYAIDIFKNTRRMQI